MRDRFWVICALSIGVLIPPSPLSAHHGNAAYDATKRITVKGTVIEWLWANPHSVILLEVTNDSGQVVHWAAETENPTTMSHSGWSKTSFKPGDEVTVTMVPANNGKPIGRIVEVVLPNGQKLAGRVLPALEPYKPE